MIKKGTMLLFKQAYCTFLNKELQGPTGMEAVWQHSESSAVEGVHLVSLIMKMI
jgi:hypothetical protein